LRLGLRLKILTRALYKSGLASPSASSHNISCGQAAGGDVSSSSGGDGGGGGGSSSSSSSSSTMFMQNDLYDLSFALTETTPADNFTLLFTFFYAQM